MAKSKFFRVAVEGATSDGRVINRADLTDMATAYNPALYGARIFAEHIRGYAPDSPFKAYGDVTALKAEEIADGPLKGKLGLYAQIDPTPEMVNLVKARQKIYSSMEITPKFADTGRAYLSGLGITDSPASLGTEVLTFASQHPDANPYATRKQHKDNLFTAAEPVEIEWEEEVSDTGAKALFKTITERIAKLAGKGQTQDAQFSEIHGTLTGIADLLEKFESGNTALTQRFAAQVKAVTDRLDAIEAANQKSTNEFAALLTQLEGTQSGPARPPGLGLNADIVQTNC